MGLKLLKVLGMLKKKLGVEAVEMGWTGRRLFNYYKISSTLIIPEGCVEIGNFAFSSCERFREVVIPENIKNIGIGAFWLCGELKKVIIPKSVKEIKDRTFQSCRNLREVIIPESVEEIGYGAFDGCEEATIILKKPEKDFKYIDKWAFGGCKDVKEEIWN